MERRSRFDLYDDDDDDDGDNGDRSDVVMAILNYLLRYS